MRARNTPLDQSPTLEESLEDWFDLPLARLPAELQERVRTVFAPLKWDHLSPEQRQMVAYESDFQAHPSHERARTYLYDLWKQAHHIKFQIAELSASATDAARARIDTLRRDLRRLESLMNIAPADSPPLAITRGKPGQPSIPEQFVAYPRAFVLLQQRIAATPDELAAWVWFGPEEGGLVAYQNVNELDPPPRFRFTYGAGPEQFNYLAPLMGCWFKVDDVNSFQPTRRFVTGATLLERWSRQPGLEPVAFIAAKIEESRLIDMHPMFGSTRAADQSKSDLPPLERALFDLADVLHVETTDFGGNVGSSLDSQSLARSSAGRAGALAKHAKPGGSYEKRDQIRAIWATGKYTSRDRCAEEESAALGMSHKAARNALIRTEDPPHRGRTLRD